MYTAYYLEISMNIRMLYLLSGFFFWYGCNKCSFFFKSRITFRLTRLFYSERCRIINTLVVMLQLSKFDMWRSRMNLRAPIGLTWSLCSPFKLSSKSTQQNIKTDSMNKSDHHFNGCNGGKATHFQTRRTCSKGQIILTDYMLFFRFLRIQMECSFC